MFLEIFSPIFWMIILIVSLVFVFKVKDLDALWFSTSSLISFIISLIFSKLNFLYQALIFLGLVLIQFLCIGLVIKRIHKKDKLQKASNSLIGKEIIMINDCNEFNKSLGAIEDVVWNVTCQSGYNLKKGETGIVVAINKNTLIVKNK